MEGKHRNKGAKSLLRSPAKWAVVAALSVLWVFVVYLAYYTVHKPFTLSIALALIDRGTDLAVWVLLVLLATAIGKRVLGSGLEAQPLEALLFGAGLGLGLLSLGTLALGMLGLLSRWAFWLGLALLLAVNLRGMRDIIRSLTPRWRTVRPSRLSLLAFAFLGVTFSLSLLLALTPPAEWDALVYHLAGPKTYIDAGRVLWVPGNFHLSFPALTEMLFLCAMLLKGDILAHLIHLAYGVLTVAAIYVFARKHFTGHVPVMAAVFFASIPTAVAIAAWAYVDLTLAFYEFMAFAAFVNWLDTRRNFKWLLVAGILCGMAMSVKYTGVAVLVVMPLLALASALKSRTGYRRYVTGLLVLILVAVAVASPWYIKNLVHTGNPIYPYIFGGHDWNELRSAWLSSIGVRMSPIQLLLLPWDVTVLGTQGTEAYDATISPYFLALLPLLLFVRKDHSVLLPLAIFSMTTYVLWIAAGAATFSYFVLRTRILFPCFAPLSVLAAYAVEGLRQLDRPQFSLHRFVLLALGVGLILNVVSLGLSVVGRGPWPFIVGAESREQFLTRQLPDGHYDALEYVNTNLPSSAQVLFFWEPRSYYCQGHCLPDVVFDHFAQLALEHGDAAGIAQALRGQNITHILVNERWLAMGTHEALFTEEHRQLLRELESQYLQPVYFDEGFYTLYEIEPPRGSAAALEAVGMPQQGIADPGGTGFLLCNIGVRAAPVCCLSVTGAVHGLLGATDFSEGGLLHTMATGSRSTAIVHRQTKHG